MVHTIKLTAFAGCPITEAVKEELEKYKKPYNLKIEIELVYRAEDAAEKGLFGSPTIVLNNSEYQRERRGAPGVYCRSFVTTGGLSLMPDVEDLLKQLKCEGVSTNAQIKNDEIKYPVLLVATDCVFTKPAKNFWSRLADETGTVVSVIVVENEPEIAARYDVSGYPCLVLDQNRRYYGFHYSNAEGKKILQQK